MGFVFFGRGLFSQTTELVQISSNSAFSQLKTNDSVIVYQCHVESATQQLSTASGQTITGTAQKYSITEKYSIIKSDTGYRVNYFIASMSAFPNKKFAGLKFKERSYWHFKFIKTFQLSDTDLKVFLALENKGKEAIVYDYGISKYNTNQLVIRYQNDYKQLVIDGSYVLSKLIDIDKK